MKAIQFKKQHLGKISLRNFVKRIFLIFFRFFRTSPKYKTERQSDSCMIEYVGDKPRAESLNSVTTNSDVADTDVLNARMNIFCNE